MRYAQLLNHVRRDVEGPDRRSRSITVGELDCHLTRGLGNSEKNFGILGYPGRVHFVARRQRQERARRSTVEAVAGFADRAAMLPGLEKPVFRLAARVTAFPEKPRGGDEMRPSSNSC